MKELRWNPAKNEWLKRTRGVSFEEMIQMPFLGAIKNHSRSDQKLMLYVFNGYVWVIPCVESENEYFLKTMYPNRRFQKLWKSGLLNIS